MKTKKIYIGFSSLIVTGDLEKSYWFDSTPLSLESLHNKITHVKIIKFIRSICLSHPRKCFPFQILYFLTIDILFLLYRSDWVSQEIDILACDRNGHHPRSALNFPWRSHISCKEPSTSLLGDITNNFPYCSDSPDGPWPVSTVLSYLFPPTW